MSSATELIFNGTVGHYEVNPSCPIVKPVEVSSPFAYPRPTDDSVRNAKITIVDDEPTVSHIIRLQLTNAGFRNFDVIVDPSKAVERIATSNPDVVLLDVHMSPVNGWQILDTLRQDLRTQHIPVLIMTASNDEANRITAFNLGALDFFAKPIVATELTARVRNTLAAKVYRDMMTNYSLQLETDVLTDALTGVANRRAFDFELKRRMVDWNRQRIPMCLLMIDIDHFKKANDRYGHQAGDVGLKQVAGLLKQTLREIDLIARYGGEEFGIILPYSMLKDGKHVAERSRELVADNIFHFNEHDFRLTVSVGSTEVLHGDDADTLMRRADSALYKAKRSGRNRCYAHDGISCEGASNTPLITSSTTSKVNLEVPENRSDGRLEDKRIAIIDDEPHIIALVCKYLRDVGYQNFIKVHDASQAMQRLRDEKPDLVLLDIRMPSISGLEILKLVREDAKLKSLPVLIFTSATDMETKVESLRLGANDYCEKPLHVAELQVRVRNTLMAKAHLDGLSDYSSTLEQEVEKRTFELSEAHREAIQCLARASEMRDDNTGRHTLRVGRYAAIIARELGFGAERITWLEHAAQLHDVGKIGVPDSILLKPAALSKEEFVAMQDHCLFGSRIINNNNLATISSRPKSLAGSNADGPKSPLMRMAALVAETHHERWDGTGYPRRLKGDEIPIEGRITAVADVFDALSTARPYKNAMPLEQCFKILFENRGSHFDPCVLDAFFRRKSEIIRTFNEYSDNENFDPPTD
ncbi:MAG: response regulator [Pirellulaceae bacterium]|nr:response regulator [Pirellulaceae bacterium]